MLKKNFIFSIVLFSFIFISCSSDTTVTINEDKVKIPKIKEFRNSADKKIDISKEKFYINQQIKIIGENITPDTSVFFNNISAIKSIIKIDNSSIELYVPEGILTSFTSAKVRIRLVNDNKQDYNDISVSPALERFMGGIKNPSIFKNTKNNKGIVPIYYPFDLVYYGKENFIIFSDSGEHLLYKLSLDSNYLPTNIEPLVGTGLKGYTQMSPGIKYNRSEIQLNTPTGLTIVDDVLFFSDSLNNKVIKFSLDKDKLESYAGMGTPGNTIELSDSRSAMLNIPSYLEYMNEDKLIINDMGNSEIKIVSNYLIPSIASLKLNKTIAKPRKIKYFKNKIYVLDESTNQIFIISDTNPDNSVDCSNKISCDVINPNIGTIQSFTFSSKGDIILSFKDSSDIAYINTSRVIKKYSLKEKNISSMDLNNLLLINDAILFATDTKNHRIIRFDFSKKELLTVGGKIIDDSFYQAGNLGDGSLSINAVVSPFNIKFINGSFFITERTGRIRQVSFDKTKYDSDSNINKLNTLQGEYNDKFVTMTQTLIGSEEFTFLNKNTTSSTINGKSNIIMYPFGEPASFTTVPNEDFYDIYFFDNKTKCLKHFNTNKYILSDVIDSKSKALCKNYEIDGKKLFAIDDLLYNEKDNGIYFTDNLNNILGYISLNDMSTDIVNPISDALRKPFGLALGKIYNLFITSFEVSNLNIFSSPSTSIEYNNDEKILFKPSYMAYYKNDKSKEFLFFTDNLNNSIFSLSLDDNKLNQLAKFQSNSCNHSKYDKSDIFNLEEACVFTPLGLTVDDKGRLYFSETSEIENIGVISRILW